ARRHEEVTAFGRGMKLTQLNGRRTVVWGLGKEGRAAARAARKAGASDVVAVVDDPPASAVVVAWSDAGLSGVPILCGPTAQAALVSSAPHVAVLTSLFPDHLPWHGNVERYYADKFRLFASQGSSRHGLVNGADPIIDALLSNPALANVTTYATNDSEVRIDN